MLLRSQFLQGTSVVIHLASGHGWLILGRFSGLILRTVGISRDRSMGSQVRSLDSFWFLFWRPWTLSSPHILLCLLFPILASGLQHLKIANTGSYHEPFFSHSHLQHSSVDLSPQNPDPVFQGDQDPLGRVTKLNLWNKNEDQKLATYFYQNLKTFKETN